MNPQSPPTMRDHTTSPAAPEHSGADALKALIHEAETALTSVKEGHSANLDDLRARLREAVDEGKAMAANLGRTVKRQAAQADDAIRANPYPSIGVALGLGLVLGILVSGRLRSNSAG